MNFFHRELTAFYSYSAPPLRITNNDSYFKSQLFSRKNSPACGLFLLVGGGGCFRKKILLHKAGSYLFCVLPSSQETGKGRSSEQLIKWVMKRRVRKCLNREEGVFHCGKLQRNLIGWIFKSHFFLKLSKPDILSFTMYVREVAKGWRCRKGETVCRWKIWRKCSSLELE